MLTAYRPKTWNAEGCMYHTWYLTDDLFFFFFAPFVIIAYKFRKWLGIGLLFSLLVASTGYFYYLANK